MRHCGRLWKQTLHPPKLVIPLADNPLTRWSTRLPKWGELGGSLTPVKVGLEGCHSAFNATNSIRTCLYFQTTAAPTFLTAPSWKAIEHVRVRDAPTSEKTATSCSAPEGNNGPSSARFSPASESCSACLASPTAPEAEPRSPFAGIALFGEDVFFRPVSVEGEEQEGGDPVPAEPPLVAIENFAERAQSVMHTRLPAACTVRGAAIRLVVGHENWGVRRSLLRPRGDDTGHGACGSKGPFSGGSASPVADLVVYVPQYGTISSLNVVTSLGIALFYCYLDAACPSARVVYMPSHSDAVADNSAAHPSPDSSTASLGLLRRSLAEYQTFFAKTLPAPSNSTAGASASADAAAHVNTTPRVDRRPVHPVFYKCTMEEIQERQRAYREALLRYSGVNPFPPTSPDGTGSECSIGTSCVTHPVFFGISVLYENVYDQRNFGGLIRNANAFLVDRILYVGRRKVNVVGAVGSYHYTPPHYLGDLPEETAATVCEAAHDEWAADIRAKVTALHDTNVPRNWWMLDCGHDFLYAAALPETSTDRSVSASHPLSLELYQRMKAEGRVRCLCEREADLREAASGGLVLLIPQEGRLPHPALLRLCTGLLTVLPDGAHYAEHLSGGDAVVGGGGHRGLPSQVASGIALQRLSAVLHPRLAAL